ncbi:hypothetical protein BY996DRAFT_6452531 [Phakopsora pachyrhizi]|nr:hypothetical protein BY996DRAFT_6452531 [Phakopsora pachyrhizi]
MPKLKSLTWWWGTPKNSAGLALLGSCFDLKEPIFDVHPILGGGGPMSDWVKREDRGEDTRPRGKTAYSGPRSQEYFYVAILLEYLVAKTPNNSIFSWSYVSSRKSSYLPYQRGRYSICIRTDLSCSDAVRIPRGNLRLEQ